MGRPLTEDSDLVQHARRELELCGQTVEGFVSYPGHSGGSAFVAREMLHALLGHQALSPLTDDPTEWIDRSEMSGEPWWQNIRDSRAMSHDGGTTYWLIDDESKAIHASVPTPATAAKVDDPAVDRGLRREPDRIDDRVQR